MHKAKDSIQEGYEVTDMNTMIISWFLIGLFVLLFGSTATILMVVRGFDASRAPLNTESLSPLATADIQVPPRPYLQMDPVEDRKAIKKANADQANGYGLLSEDGEMKLVHIPVDRALELVAAGEVPYRQTPKTALLPTEQQ